MSDNLTIGTWPKRIHVHLHAQDIGAPSLAAGDLAMSVFAPGSASFAVDDDRIEQAARAKFAADGWIVVEDDEHDLDIGYDGEVYVIEAWVR